MKSSSLAFARALLRQATTQTVVFRWEHEFAYRNVLYRFSQADDAFVIDQPLDDGTDQMIQVALSPAVREIVADQVSAWPEGDQRTNAFMTALAGILNLGHRLVERYPGADLDHCLLLDCVGTGFLEQGKQSIVIAYHGATLTLCTTSEFRPDRQFALDRRRIAQELRGRQSWWSWAWGLPS
jgi:hypothetical protein